MAFITEPFVRNKTHEVLAKMIVPDHIPGNAYRGAPIYKAEHLLMTAILEDAIACATGNVRMPGGSNTPKVKVYRSKKVEKETLEWLFSDDRSWIYAFLNICDHLRLDPAAVRKRVNDVRLMQAASEHETRKD